MSTTTTKLSRRWDSSSRNSLEKDNPVNNDIQFSSERASGPVSIDDENRSLRRRVAQLEAENERLKASVFLLTERLNMRRSEPTLSMDSLLSAAAPQQPTQTTAAPSPNGLPPVPISNQRRTSGELSAILPRPSRDWPDDESDEIIADALSCRTTLAAHTGAVYACKYSFDGTALASTSLDCTVRIWNLSTGTNQIIGNHAQSGSDLLWLGSSRVASASLDTTVKVWETVKLNPASPIHSFSASGVVLSLTATDHNLLAAGTSSGTIHRFDIRAPGTIDATAMQGDAAINALCFGEGMIFSGDTKGRLRAWDLRISRPDDLYTVEGRRPISGIVYSPSGYLAVNSYDNALRVFCKGSTEHVKLIHTLRGHRSKNWPIRASFSLPSSHQPGLVIATGSSSNESLLFGHLPTSTSSSANEPENISVIQQLHGHLGSVYSCDFSSDNHLATCSADGTLKVWWRRW